MKFAAIENKIFDFFIGENTKRFVEKTILYISIFGFLVHLLLIYLFQSNVLKIDDPYGLLSSPISAIYTPFSFILIYEIYQLIYYLPRSISVYISKQYEIITLIIIRRIFKDISNLNLNQNLFTSNTNEYLFVDLAAAAILFFLIFLFRFSFKKKKTESPETINLLSFIRVKKWISTVLLPVISLLAIFHFYNWAVDSIYNDKVVHLKSLNSIFFDELFQTLILVDVFLLLFSFFNSDRFHNIMRNSGFIISTILIRLSFMTEGLNNVALIIISVLFGLCIQLIFNECEKKNLF
ncbi:MAG: hypothetical protein VXY26_00030 [Bacteroidota bacterium]|nr:hypothetical protein [Bacteroidota bacterium]